MPGPPRPLPQAKDEARLFLLGQARDDIRLFLLRQAKDDVRLFFMSFKFKQLIRSRALFLV